MPASYPVPTQATGHVVTAAEWNLLVDDINDLDSRATTSTSAISTINTNLGTWSGGTAISRITTLETRTTDTSGTVGIGNQRLSDRLGATITTASTAAAQLALKADKTTTISAGTGLTGGGDLSANRTLTVAYGTTSTTATVGNDSRVTVTQDATIGNSALGTRVSNLEGPSCIAVMSSTQSIANVTDTILSFSSAPRNDSYGGSPMWAAGSPTLVTIRRTGLYQLSATIIYDPQVAAVSGQRLVYILKNATAPASNGSATLGYAFFVASGTSPGGGVVATCASAAYLTSGDVLRVSGYQSQGSTINYMGNSYGGPCQLSVMWQGV